MKTKQYLFTIRELYALRDALVEYRQFLRQHNCQNDLSATVGALADQFKQDVATWKE